MGNPMSAASHPPITLVDYERLFRVIHGVLNFATQDPAKESLFFAVAGAFTLKRHHKLNSVSPVVGAAGYGLPVPAKAPLLFGQVTGDTLTADEMHHHCWIEADGWIIDLSAPLFDAHLPSEKKTGALPACMFQRPVTSPVSLADLGTPGASLHRVHERLTTTRLEQFSATPAFAELVRLCAMWYARSPKKLAPALGLSAPDGSSRTMTLSPIRLTGAY